jgi:hypothetical protein
MIEPRMSIPSASTTVLKKKVSNACSVTRRRWRGVVMLTPETWVAPTQTAR